MRNSLIFMLMLIPHVFAFGQRMPETIIKIGLMESVRSFNMSCQESYYIYEISNGSRSDITPMDDYLVKGQEDKIVIDSRVFTSPIRLVAGGAESRLRINGRRYRDSLFISCKNGKLTVVNELGIEDYVYGILPCEVSPQWGPESLKSQAVISRTYALRNLRRHEKSGFDLCNQTHCQVYGGVESEDPRSNAAVDATRGEVLTYQGQLAQTLFHASCAGHTENPRFVWTSLSNNIPSYLDGRKDKYCSDSPHSIWKGSVKEEVIRSKLKKAGYSVGKISRIQMSGKTKSGRTKLLIIKHSLGKLTMPAARFRQTVDTWLIKSAFLTGVSRSGNSFEFKGRGWGHGVGLCQWGAKVMADEGHDYRDILEFYYPGTAVETWEE